MTVWIVVFMLLPDYFLVQEKEIGYFSSQEECQRAMEEHVKRGIVQLSDKIKWSCQAYVIEAAQ